MGARVHDLKRVASIVSIFITSITTAAISQEKVTVSIAELLRVHETVKTIAEMTADQRQEMISDQAARLFIESVVESQRLLEPAIILIAETDAPKSAQLYAISVAIAAKQTELALWHYINAFVSNEQRYLESADGLLTASLDELERATSLLPAEE